MTPDLDALDRMAAIHCMKWVIPTPQHTYYTDPSDISAGLAEGTARSDIAHWHPTKSIEQAWKLLDKLPAHTHKKIMFDVDYGLDQKSGWNVSIDFVEHETWSSAAPEAITRACLRASGVEI